MPRQSPFTILLSDEEQEELEATARRYTALYFEVVRAKIVLYAAQGMENQEIAARLDVPRQVVSKWRKHSTSNAFRGWRMIRGPGARPVFPPHVVVQVKALACELPVESGVPLSRWSREELAREVTARGIVASISGSTIWRWLDRGRDSAMASPQLDLSA